MSEREDRLRELAKYHDERAASVRAQIAQIKRDEAKPKWTSLDGDKVTIRGMTDQHLVNSIKVMLRLDARYFPRPSIYSPAVKLTPEKMEEFFWLVSQLFHPGRGPARKRLKAELRAQLRAKAVSK